MDKINDFYIYLSEILDINVKYVSLILNTILCYIILLIAKLNLHYH